MLAHRTELSLARALRVEKSSCLALVGAGGKTSAMFALARQLPKPVFLTTTTHLAVEQGQLADRHIILDEPESWHIEEIPQEVVLFSGQAGAAERLGGLQGEALAMLHRASARLQVPLLIEADGSRRLPLKAPSEHEPVIPDFAEIVVVTAGLSGLEKPLDETQIHRPERFAALSGLALGERVTVEALTRVLLDPQGGLKGIPAQARRVVLLNQADTAHRQVQAHLLAERLLPVYQSVVISRLAPGEEPADRHAAPFDRPEVFAALEPVAGVILAAGAAERFNSPKQVLDWQGEPLVRHVARTALSAGLDPVVVVTGAHTSQVESALQDLLRKESRLKVVYNPYWKLGQGTSVRTGVLSLPVGCGAAIMLLVDQPQTPPSLLRSLREAHSTSLATIIAPLVQGERANPVLFDRDLFSELARLSGEEGGRALFKYHSPMWLPWHDPRQALDIDTPEDYQRLLDSGD